MSVIELHDNEFKTFQKVIFEAVGITLNDSKKTLVQSRLNRRMVHYKLDSFTTYLRIIAVNSSEKMQMINLITTNETYFFREEAHFNFMKKIIASRNDIRIWSAASSVGAEAYSLAMLCNEAFSDWKIYGSDINSEVIKKARMGLYPLSWIDKIPDNLKSKYCLKGKGNYEGQFLIDRELTKNMSFFENNLLKINTKIGQFDVIFLRNVLLYFNDETKQKVVENVVANLKTGGYLIISLTENLQSVQIPFLKQVATSIYQKDYNDT